MKVTTTDSKTFELVAEDDADMALLWALHQVRHMTWVKPLPRNVEGGGWEVAGGTMLVDREDPRKSVIDAGQQALSAIGQLFGLGLREATYHLPALALLQDQKLHESLASLHVKLDAMAHPGGRHVLKGEVVSQELGGHGSSSGDAAEPSVGRGGAA